MHKTPAFKAVDEYRDAFNTGAIKVQAKDLSTTVYLSDFSGRPVATMYIGKAKKTFKRVGFRSEEDRANQVAHWMKAQSERQAQSKQRRKPAQRLLEVGDVLVASWGYEQTNVDYYKVIKLVGTATVELVEIGKQQNEDLWMQGKCIPDPEAEIGTPFRRRAQGEHVKINSSSYARKKNPEFLPGGVKVFNADRWSAYH